MPMTTFISTAETFINVKILTKIKIVNIVIKGIYAIARYDNKIPDSLYKDISKYIVKN